MEISSALGLDYYESTGKKQQRMVDESYLEVLEALEK